MHPEGTWPTSSRGEVLSGGAAWAQVPGLGETEKALEAIGPAVKLKTKAALEKALGEVKRAEKLTTKTLGDVERKVNASTVGAAAGALGVAADLAGLGDKITSQVNAATANIGSAGSPGDAAAGTVVTGSASCAPGSTCAWICPDGDCTFMCGAGAKCQAECKGGDCIMGAAAGATVQFDCKGGSCKQDAAAGARGSFSCAGGDCERKIDKAAAITTSCSGEDCS